MAYVTPIHNPTSVRAALKLCLRNEGEECLAVARFNRLEIHVLVQISTPDGVQTELDLVTSTRIFGRITVLNKIRPAGSSVDHIFIGTDLCRFFTMAWDDVKGSLRTEKTFQDLADQTLRLSQSGERCHIDPTGRFLTLEVYEGIITTIPLHKQERRRIERGFLLNPITSRIPEFFVKSSAFLARRNETEEPQFAMLYGDLENRPRLRIRTLVYGQGDPADVEFKDITSDDDISRQPIERIVHEDVDFGASHIIPLQEAPYGMLILGETSITYYDDEIYKAMQSRPLPEANVWVAWERIDNTRYILGDEYGNLWLLKWDFEEDSPGNFTIDKLGEIPRATCLVYMGEGLIFVGTHYGDSQLIRIIEKGLEVLQTIPSLSPILDFTVMDMGNRSAQGPSNEFSTGQARIVTCSGAWNGGSIRSVRSGVGLIEHAVISDVAHATQLFSLPISPGSELHNILLVSFVDESRVFLFDQDGNVEERTEYKGLSLDSPTLFAGAVWGDFMLQVTPESVAILDFESGFKDTLWSPEDASSTVDGGVITAVSVHDSLVAVIVDGAKVVILDSSPILTVQVSASFAPKQVSCVAISPLLPDLCFVGFWYDAEITVLDLKTMKSISKITLIEDGDGGGPQSIVISQLFSNRNPTALFAMGDGHVISFEIEPKSAKTGQRTITILGTKQPSLQELPRGDGTSGVFVSSEHPSLIYEDDGRLAFSAVDSQDFVNCVCRFNSQAYPHAIVLATPTEIKICLLHDTRTTQVQPLYTKETVRCIAYSPTLKAFGLGTISRRVEESVEYTKSSFKLVDEVMFKELATVNLRQDERVDAVMRIEIKDRYGQLTERFIVGTSFSDDEAVEKFKGRIIVYEVTEDRKLKAVASVSVKTACQCLAMVGDDIVAALHKTIVIYSLINKEGSQWSFKKQAAERISVIPVAVSVYGNQIAVSDIMKSLSILEYKREGEDPAYSGPALVEVARHYGLVWATSMTQVRPDYWVQGDAEGNILLLQRNREGVTSDDKRRLQVTGEFRLGELVNKMCKIDVGPSNAAVEPKAFLATREGALYLFALIVPGMMDFLLTLQQNLASRVESAGGIPFNEYRALRIETKVATEPHRIVDGELVERYLDLSDEIQQASIEGIMLEGKQVTVEQTKVIIEGLRRLH